MKTYFLKPGDDNMLKQELTNLFKLNGNLHIAVAYFNNEYFSDLIIERAKQKLKTFLILNTSDIVRPKEAGESEIVISKALFNIIKSEYLDKYIFCKSLGVKITGNYQNMHHKFIFNKDKIFVGSLNLTDAALHRNFESIIEIDDRITINKFYKEFEVLWNSSSEILTNESGKLRSIMCPKCETSECVDFESCGPFCFNCGYKFIID